MTKKTRKEPITTSPLTDNQRNEGFNNIKNTVVGPLGRPVTFFDPNNIKTPDNQPTGSIPAAKL